MPRFAEVTHEEWIAAPIQRVRAQFADLQHHIRANVHPKLSLSELGRAGAALRYEQRVKLLGIRQRDVFERSFGVDGSMTDRSVEGFNQGGSLHFSFVREVRGEGARRADGTSVSVTVKLPLPPVIGPLIAPLLRKQIRKELLTAVAEDKYDLEVRGYAGEALAA